MKSDNFLGKILPFWLTLVVVITLLCGLIYASVQQTLRQGANDPQIQIAQDFADQLSQTKELPSLNSVIDIKKSLATFVIIYDKKGKPISSTALLNNEIPSPPLGVFQNAEIYKENRVTWQPQSDIRIASVIVPYGNKSGFILAGRSLREVEKRVNKITAFTFIGWIGTVIGSFITLAAMKIILK